MYRGNINMNTSASNRRLRVLLTAIRKEHLIPQPDFQRRLVWANKDKVEFIRTVLEGFPFPEIYIAAGKVDPKTGEGSEMLVDGQQRITTLYQYFKGSKELRLPAEIPSYSDLEEAEQMKFLEYEVVVRDLGSKPIDEVKQIFQRINSTSYGLNTMEIHNSRYAGAFKTFAEKLSTNDFFEAIRLFNATDIKRMNDVRYCLALVTTLMSNYFTRDNEIEDYLKRFNESFKDEAKIKTEIDAVINTIDSLNFPAGSRAYKKADFFTLFIEIHKAIYKKKITLNIIETRRCLDGFYERVQLASEGINTTDGDAINYYKAALQGSNDRGNRITRGQLLQSYLVE